MADDKVILKACAGWKNDIELLEFERETDHSIFMSNGRKYAKLTNNSKMFKSFKDAKKWLVERKQEEVDFIKIQLKRAKERLEKVKSIKSSEVL